jgi:hypothetical protein
VLFFCCGVLRSEGWSTAKGIVLLAAKCWNHIESNRFYVVCVCVKVIFVYYDCLLLLQYKKIWDVWRNDILKHKLTSDFILCSEECRIKSDKVGSISCSKSEIIYKISLCGIRGCIQKFPDWVDNEINKKKHSLRSNAKGYGGKTH